MTFTTCRKWLDRFHFHCQAHVKGGLLRNCRVNGVTYYGQAAQDFLVTVQHRNRWTSRENGPNHYLHEVGNAFRGGLRERIAQCLPPPSKGAVPLFVHDR